VLHSGAASSLVEAERCVLPDRALESSTASELKLVLGVAGDASEATIGGEDTPINGRFNQKVPSIEFASMMFF
jgi:hypothetical protein